MRMSQSLEGATFGGITNNIDTVKGAMSSPETLVEIFPLETYEALEFPYSAYLENAFSSDMECLFGRSGQSNWAGRLNQEIS